MLQVTDADGASTTVDVTPTHVALMCSDSEIYSWDRSGRLLSYFDGTTHFWRGMSGEAILRQTDANHCKQVKRLTPAYADSVVREAQQRCSVRPWRDVDPVVYDRIRYYDPGADRQCYRTIYGKIPVFPPDAYLSVVLQATIGCAWNRCTFCDFYRDAPYRVRAPEQFRAHAASVRGFLGDSLLLRKRIFLGDADVLGIGTGWLTEDLRTVADIFPGLRCQGFCEALSALARRRNDLVQFRELGLTRLAIGAESGHDPLLAAWKKRSRSADVAEAVAALKESGYSVGVIFLAGVPAEFETAHLTDTERLVHSLALGEGDFVYISPLVESENGAAQAKSLRSALRPLQAKGVRIAAYDIRQIVY